jgi:tetratricopeptide (TPR) repeat protein
LRHAIAQNPADAEARYYLGSSLLKLNDPEGAVTNLSEAVRLNPYESGARVALAGALNKLGRQEDAQKQLQEAQAIDALKANAGRSRVLLESAVQRLNKGDVDTALSELGQSVALSPEYPEAQFQLARAMLKKGAPPAELAKTLRRVIELKPDYAEAHLQLGLVLEHMGQQIEALTELKKSVDLAPSLAEAHRVLGKAALTANDWPAAISEFSAVLAWNKDDPQGRQGVSFALAHLKQK